MKILRAEHYGMCFGVRDAIALALRQAAQAPLTILGELVHNETILGQLRSRGIQIQNSVEAVETQVAMVTAHGASQTALRRARDQGLTVVEATCPLVHLAHRSVTRLVQEGYYPVIIGKKGHVEVRGLTEDLAECDIILTEEDVARMTERARYGVAAQTTQSIQWVRHLVDCIRQRFPSSEVRFIDTVCQPTKQRQAAAVEMAQQAEVVVVVGGRASNNTAELTRSCRKYCERVYQVQNETELRAEWFVGVQIVGLTAGTSTPDSAIDAVERRIQELAAAPALRE